MDGSDKLPLFLICKTQRPRAFKNVKVPVANEKALMTDALFESRLRTLDRLFRLEGRKIAMVIDNCPAHPSIQVTNIRLLFLPPNTTSHTQPMDSGIIKNLKYHYRKIKSNQSFMELWNLLDAVVALKASWKRVTA